MTTLTPEQFLAQREPDAPEETEAFGPFIGVLDSTGPGPLDSIAASLQLLVGMVQAGKDEEHEADRYRVAYDDLEAKHDSLYGLLEEVEAIIKPSVGKLAISVREAIARWRGAPETPTADEGPERLAEWERELLEKTEAEGRIAEPSSDAIVSAAVQCDACRLYFTDQAFLERHECAGAQPANDAPVEEWREFARGVGFSGPDVDKANRSQIRTMLGVSQTRSASDVVGG